ncbi:MAG: rhomboid family intramembrane serine protease [Spirochaetales bacterium]|nr:rhomboid family intramembrane serine protease [Spirochaetales bacterium]
MKLRYNAPVILTYALICTGIMVVWQILGGEGGPGIDTLGDKFVAGYFSVPSNTMGFNFLSLDIYKLFSHALGHGNWMHLLSNFTFILLIGPITEEKYGSGRLLFMMIITAGVSGLINVLFFATSSLGASGIVFMLILLVSITNVRSGEIPLTFIAIVLIYLTGEIINMFAENNINEAAHLLGGLCGSIFGFTMLKGKTEKNGDASGTTDNPLGL